jgi:hypothetical protein
MFSSLANPSDAHARASANPSVASSSNPVEAVPSSDSTPAAVIPPNPPPSSAAPASESSTNNAASRRKSYWRYFAVLAPLALYIWDSRNKRKLAVELARKSVVSADPEEVIDIIHASELNSEQLYSIYAEAAAAFPHSSYFVLEDVGSIVAKHIDRDRVKSLARDPEKQRVMYPWEILSFFRLSPVDSEQRLHYTEIMTALSMLVEDPVEPSADPVKASSVPESDPNSQVKAADLKSEQKFAEASRPATATAGSPPEPGSQVKASDLKNAPAPPEKPKVVYNPMTKFDLAWAVHDPSKQGVLSFPEFQQLVERMLRTGHFDPRRLPVRSGWLPARYSLLTAQDIALLYYQGLRKTPETDRISLDEFKLESMSLSRAETAEIWYLHDRRKGFFSHFSQRWRERFLRLRAQHGW